MPAIFISHSSEDEVAAGKIMAILARLGFERVFLDFDKTTGLGVGDHWEKRLYEELTRCHAILLILTPAWLASKWCFAELTQARALGKVILPVLCEHIGGQLVLPEIQAISLIDWNPDGVVRLEQRLQAITGELARGFTLDPDRPPYPGIHAFEAADAAIYFGRDEESRAVIERLDARRIQGGTRFLVIIGASGSGKSSLLKAGVLPQLGRRRRQWVVLPDMRPEKAPMEALAKALAQHGPEPVAWRTWHDALSGPQGVAAIDRFTQDVRVGDARSATVLLPVDQFEELFTRTAAAERKTFLALLAALLERDVPLMVVATGRSDVLEGLIESTELIKRYETYPLGTVPIDRVPRLIEGPAAIAGIHVEEGLTERIVRDLESADALPLLAHMLSLLCQRGNEDRKLAVADYLSLGDAARGLNPIQNSVRRAADEAIAQVAPSEAETAALRDAFVPHLVRIRLDDGKRVRQPARRSELPTGSLRLVGALEEARLLSTRPDEGETLVEVTHEALFKAWPTLDRWLAEEHAFLTDIERVRDAQENWSGAAIEERSGELLYGLLLSRTREWLQRYPQRFLSRDMAPLSAFIKESAGIADAARDRQRKKDRGILLGAIAAAALFAGVALVAGGLFYQARQAEQLAVQAQQLAEQRKQAAVDAARRGSQMFIRAAEREIAAGRGRTAVLLALEALPANMKDNADLVAPDARDVLLAALAIPRERLRIGPATIGGEIKIAELSSAGDHVIGHDIGYGPTIVDAANGSKLFELQGHDSFLTTAQFSPDSSLVATGAMDGRAFLFNANDGRMNLDMGTPGNVNFIRFSGDGKRLIVVPNGDPPVVWDLATRTERRLADFPYRIESGELSFKGDWLVGGGKVWNLNTSRVTAEIESWEAVFSPDETAVIPFSKTGSLTFIDPATGKETRTLTDPNAVGWRGSEEHRQHALGRPKAHEAAIRSVAFNVLGTLMASGSEDTTVKLWDPASGKLIRAFPGHQKAVTSVKFSADGLWLVSGSEDSTVRVWDTSNGRQLWVFGAEHNDPILKIQITRDSKTILTHHGLVVRLWDVGHSRPRIPPLEHDSLVREVRADLGLKQAMTHVTNERYFRVWDLTSGTVLRQVRFAAEDTERPGANRFGENRAIARFNPTIATSNPTIALSGDGRYAAIGDTNGVDAGAVAIWDLATRSDPLRLDSKWGPVKEIRLSADGAKLLALYKNAAVVWNTASNSAEDVVAGAEFERMLLNDDNSKWYLAGPDRIVERFPGSGRERVVERDDNCRFSALTLGHAEKLAAFTCADSPPYYRDPINSSYQTLRAIDMNTGRRLATAKVSSDAPERPVGFTSDAKGVLVYGYPDQLRVISTETGASENLLRVPAENVHGVWPSQDGVLVLYEVKGGLEKRGTVRLNEFRLLPYSLEALAEYGRKLGLPPLDADERKQFSVDLPGAVSGEPAGTDK